MTRVLSISFERNGTPWLDPIMDVFRTDLSSTGLPFNFITIHYNSDKNIIEEQILAIKPNFCFFPDYFLANLFNETCKKAKAKVVFVSNFKSNFAFGDDAGGIFIDFPADKSFGIVKKITPIKSVGIIGGSWPGAKHIADDIKSKIQKDAFVEVYNTKSWHDYTQKIREWESKHGAIWVLIPFGVYTDKHVEVSHSEVAKLVAGIKVPTIGFGSIKGDIKRTFNIGPDPMKIGRYAAGILYQMMHNEKPGIREFKELEFGIDKNSLKALGLDKRLPRSFEHFLM